MLEIGWSELLVIAIVLIVVVGPKDLPRMLRTFGRATSQMRRMAGDFRRQFDEALREAEMEDVRDTIADVKKLNPAADVRKALNPMKAVGDEIRSSLAAATRAPEPKVPTPDAPAQPVEPAKTGAVSETSTPAPVAPPPTPAMHPAAVPASPPASALPEPAQQPASVASTPAEARVKAEDAA
ncbi:Sec-independent protein translocase protein TatB [Antarcticirhabdus aurantiaca]|uniref:Sec-independent protein translocase protein TatB n=1 Tax=Antarcticirhabdus aurantiaca TaxID=2606717 RepID=A0ACD4NWN5_9HYPH|nr:Sec-independent protein translocase protein TatB [Antarcticirhabdus aurantiaca]WAJ31128.1 Sec-independent protein translocase protein TatB [Jeongeuplla avenae]